MRSGKPCTVKESKAPSGFEIVMNTNHHLSKPRHDRQGQSIRDLRRGLALHQPDQSFSLEPVHSREREIDRRLDLPLGLRGMSRADIQEVVIEGPARMGTKWEARCGSKPTCCTSSADVGRPRRRPPRVCVGERWSDTTGKFKSRKFWREVMHPLAPVRSGAARGRVRML